MSSLRVPVALALVARLQWVRETFRNVVAHRNLELAHIVCNRNTRGKFHLEMFADDAASSVDPAVAVTPAGADESANLAIAG
jgi:hypothetical protein